MCAFIPWTMCASPQHPSPELERFLVEINLEQHLEVFRAGHHLDLDSLRRLSDSDYADLKIPSRHGEMPAICYEFMRLFTLRSIFHGLIPDRGSF